MSKIWKHTFLNADSIRDQKKRDILGIAVNDQNYDNVAPESPDWELNLSSERVPFPPISMKKKHILQKSPLKEEKRTTFSHHFFLQPDVEIND